MLETHVCDANVHIGYLCWNACMFKIGFTNTLYLLHPNGTLLIILSRSPIIKDDNRFGCSTASKIRSVYVGQLKRFDCLHELINFTPMPNSNEKRLAQTLSEPSAGHALLELRWPTACRLRHWYKIDKPMPVVNAEQLFRGAVPHNLYIT